MLFAGLLHQLLGLGVIEDEPVGVGEAEFGGFASRRELERLLKIGDSFRIAALQFQNSGVLGSQPGITWRELHCSPVGIESLVQLLLQDCGAPFLLEPLHFGRLRLSRQRLRRDTKQHNKRKHR